MMKKIAVAVGVVTNRQGQILLALRHEHLHQGGKWEFPGGKIEQGEQTFDALSRELNEEVNINVEQASPLIKLEYDYGDKLVVLDVWQVSEFSGVAQGMEQQQIKWVDKVDLANYQFPDANQPIVDLLIKE
ncbi:8-oxo-dGTP diphosphatase MutT [Psychrobium sp. 1_MG-2023]|uniref:8-oxo-dGTP diphosphatase MutT n=1 Tax=Psychrobium sp. 1_MG-2023 TaxID=3062624 RepID=UPI000C32C92E|nr:8-oxo-dGTP diphosphatase MutT [Psychrobium sp. 1_MG-2023]MDP2562030.1 8-oxo-dGTP diphosphatase MutT [Psychrobium sp. 1_MG-2023]PKF58517.1 8-oxo-dGTP diphosphatase MutT [Alteromonadales bacterium alter-6D02]